jgi:hypothetical protein
LLPARLPDLEDAGIRRTLYQAKRGRNVGTLWALIVLAALASAGLRFLRTPGDRMLLVGALAVFFGLFVCSRAAANMIDMLLFDRFIFSRRSTRRFDLLWIGLNLLTLFVGWITIIEGTTRLVGRPG